jgi:parvulin-like peptidyl-prolyl isomerase
MTDKLDLSLPKQQMPPQKLPKSLVIINLVVLALTCATLAVVLISFKHMKPGAKCTALSVDAQKELALKLENQGLTDVAASAWKDYLEEAHPGNEEAARIWFRIGSLYQNAHKYEKALAGYYRSEQFASLKDISPDISRRVQECLESMGQFAALRDELADRVGLKENNSKQQTPGRETVVAEIGPEKITLSDLDHEIEKTIDQQISRLAPYMPEDMRNKQKEMLLKQFSSDPQRQQFLGQYIAQVLLYRQARADNLTADPEIQSEIKDQERALLADKELQRAYADNIKITDEDLRNYYKAHLENYKTPDRAKISLIEVKDASEAANVRKALEQGKNFADVAKKYSIDAANAKNGGKIDQWIEKGAHAAIPEIGDAKDAADMIFATNAGKVVAKNITGYDKVFVVKVDAKEPEKQKSFEEVKNDVSAALRSQKQQEVRESLFNTLKDKYDVVLHSSALTPQSEKNAKQDNVSKQSQP